MRTRSAASAARAAVSATTIATASPAKRARSVASGGYGATKIGAFSRPRERELVRVGRHRAMGDVREAVGRRVPAGQHREHARDGERGGGVDPTDPSVRVRRADEDA